VTTEADADRILVNDWAETINNVWFMSGTSPVSYCHVIAQVAGSRWVHFSFGIIDPLGQTHTACAYAAGVYYQWWDDNAIGNNNPADTDHRVGFYGEDQNVHVRITDANVLPIGFGPTPGIYGGTQLVANMTRVLDPEDHYAAVVGVINDQFMALDNQPVTGGTPLWGMPVMVAEDVAPDTGVWIGNFPGVAMVNMLSHAPGSTIKQGSEEWLVFPLKRKGALDEVQGQPNVVALANTTKYGLAYKKVT
jgi:hypothetical protein